MEKRFIAFFDYLGFKQFIENNDIETQQRVMGNIQRDIEQSLILEKNGKRNNKLISNSVAVADLSQIKINCILFSDTVIFWSKDNSLESLEDLLRISFDFNSKTNRLFFPARGAIVYDYIEQLQFKKVSQNSATYNINSVYGVGIVNAHQKAESQNWAGTVIDNSIIDHLEENSVNLEDYLLNFTKLYAVPYKSDTKNTDEEYVLKLFFNDINQSHFKNTCKDIRSNFSRHNKTVNDSVEEKINNTIDFLKSCTKNEQQ